jgi:hypothetical protein
MGSGGQANNVSSSPYVINIPSNATPTPEPPTATPYPPPQIYFFDPGDVTIARGDSVVLSWQVYGDNIGVTLDGAPMPAIVDSYEVFPTADHVYTLRAENPGGVVIATCRITVVDPTATPTLTPTPCDLPIIHAFNATKTSIVRGQQTTLYWDLSGATEAYLDGSGVPGVSEKTVTLYQTTIFTLRAVNGCGPIEDTLQITVRYATPTPTRTPTRTPTPSRTPTPTYTPRPPTATPTRNVLPTPTWTATAAATIASTATITTTATPDLATPPTVGPQVPTITPGVTGTPGTFDSPLGTPTPGSGAVPTSTSTVAPTETVTASTTPTSTAQPDPAGSLATVTPTPAWNVNTPTSQPAAQSITPTAEGATEAASPTPTRTAGIAGTMRMYLCPLGILIVFALSVLVLSVILPRIREQREAQEALPLQPADTVFDPGQPLVTSRPAPARAPAHTPAHAFTRAPVVEDPVTIEINDLIPRRQSGSSIDDPVSIEINDQATIRKP